MMVVTKTSHAMGHMRHPCKEQKSAHESHKLVFDEVREVIHGGFTNTKDINDLSEHALTFFIRDGTGQVVSAAYGTTFRELEVYLYYFATHFKHRRQGYGSSLLYWLVNSDKFSFSRIIVNVGKEQTKIINFYKKLGFQPMQRKERQDRNIYRQNETTMSLFGRNMKMKKIVPDIDRIEWFDPLKINYVMMVPGVVEDDPPRMKFNRVMVGWQFEDKKWQIQKDMTKIKAGLKIEELWPIQLHAGIVIDEEVTDFETENGAVCGAITVNTDVNDEDSSSVSVLKEGHVRHDCDEDCGSINSKKRRKKKVAHEKKQKKKDVIDDNAMHDAAEDNDLDMDAMQRREVEFLTGIEEVKKTLDDMEERLNYILR
jgi:GNAT superfamily N-acetyltransferase